MTVPEGAEAQPSWVTGTPSVSGTNHVSITVNYGLTKAGTVYYIVYNFDNSAQLTSSYVRINALLGPSGTKVASGSLSVKKGDAGKVLQLVIDGLAPNQVHTIFIVAADTRGVLQGSPVRLIATTLACPLSEAGSGGDECSLSFSLGAVSSYGTGQWRKMSGPGNASFSPNAANPSATVTVTIYGTYVFRWSETEGNCSSYDEITVNFYRQPSANAGNDDNVCGLEYDLSANTPSAGTGTWTMSSGTGTATFIPDAGSPDAVVSVSAYGAKVFTWTVTNGTCSASSEVSVNFHEVPVADAGQGGNNCGPVFYLSADPGIYTGEWSKATGSGNAVFTPGPGDPTAQVTVSQFGAYTFRWTVTDGFCSSNSVISVNFSEGLSANAGRGGDECDRDFRLNAIPGGGTGTWAKISGSGNVVFAPDAHHPDALVTVTQFGDYNFAWTEVKDNCSSTDIIKVTFHAPPAVSAGPDLTVCQGNSVQLSASGTGSFMWSPTDLLDDPLIYDPVATPGNTTTFTVRLTDVWGCTNSDKVIIEVREMPSANAGNDRILDYAFKDTLNAGPLDPGEGGEWKVITGTGAFENINDPGSIISDLSLGDNILVWSVSNGVCPKAADTIAIMVNDLVLPTMITPNMDGRNDYFVLKGIQSLGKTSLTVFNRWGAMVFSSDSYDNSWDGKDYKGNSLPDDTYFIIINSDNHRPISGYIVIRR